MDMKFRYRHYVLAAVMLSYVVPAFPEEIFPGYVDGSGKYFLHGTYVHVKKLAVGVDIPLNSLVIMPKSDVSALVTLVFPRETLTEQCINDLFLRPNKSVVARHPFAGRGIEATLYKDYLELKIHSGIRFHLRNDISGIQEYRTFMNTETTGRVNQVENTVLYSTDSTIGKDLDDFYLEWYAPTGASVEAYRAPDGSIHGYAEATEEDFPPFFPPKVSEDGIGGNEEWQDRGTLVRK